MPTFDNLISRARDQRGQLHALTQVLRRTGWTSGLRAVEAAGTTASLLELSCADEPQALVVVAPDFDASVAASLGYSREAPYTLWWGAQTLALQDSRFWHETPGDRPLATAAFDDRWAVRDLIELLAPKSVLDDLPAQYGSPSKRRPQLHETLSQALAALRLQVANAGLMGGAEPHARDTAILRLFHQLLFIRFQEDRDQAASDVQLRRIRAGDDVNAAVLTALEDYRRRLNSTLFAPAGIAVHQLPSAALHDVIREMVEPWQRLRLNFSVSRSEIAGRLYQSYLRLLPVRESTRAQRAFFERALPVDQREKTASYYTPPGLAALVVDRALSPWLAEHRPERPDEVRILDPACGSGAFLIAAYRTLLRYFARLYERRLTPEEREHLLLTSIFGADVDERALGLAQVQLLEEAHQRGRLPALGDNLLLGDSLAAPPGYDAGDHQVDWTSVIARTAAFDVVVTNPPFGSSVKIPGRVQVADLRQLRARYPEVYSGHADYAYVFAALSLRLLRPGGVAGFILPRTVLDAPSGLALRQLLSGAGVRSIIDFRAGELFDIRGYVCAVSTGEAKTARISTVIDSRTDGRVLIEQAATGRGGTLRHKSIPVRALAQRVGNGWSGFRLRWDLDLRAELATALTPLVPESSVDRSARFGTKPAALASFIVRSEDVEPVDAETIAVGGRPLPSRFFPLVVRGGDVLPFHLADTGERVLVPFEIDGSLTTNASVLDEVQRRGGLPRNVQHGDLRTLSRPKLLMRTLSREPATVADLIGDRMPLMGTAGAIAVRLDDVASRDLHAFEALLNASLYQWLLQGIGRPKHGGWVELTISDVADLPVPVLDAENRRTLITCADAVRTALAIEDPMLRRASYHEAYAVLDDLVLDLVDASKKLRGTIDDDLFRVA